MTHTQTAQTHDELWLDAYAPNAMLKARLVDFVANVVTEISGTRPDFGARTKIRSMVDTFLERN